MQVKVTIYNIRNGAMRMLVSTSIKFILEHISLIHRLPDIVYLYISRSFVTLKIQVKVTMQKFRNSSIRWLLSTSAKVVLKHVSLALNQVKVTDCNFCNYINRWQIPKSTNVSHTFLRQLLPFQRYQKFIIFYRQKVGKSHEVQFSQLHHLIANVTIYKCL